ncbi:unnamed protein product [Rotaria sp. Silwood2]|nr:unnamed protein product [Rotaria sp. Silwood2]
MQQQQRLAHILEIVQDLIALSVLRAAESITFILDLELSVHYILINKDYFDKIEKQLSNSNSQVSSIPSVIQLTQSSSTVTTTSKPQFRSLDFKRSTFQSLSSMLKINSNIELCCCLLQRITKSHTI